MEDSENFLSYFLGPKAENANFFEELILLVIRDYFHWRRNYFPGDKILISKEMQRILEPNYDDMYQNISELIAELRRNFPFYSSRYIAHMLSDTVIPSMVGYLAGMLYNPNNLTTEAAPVTVDLEIEACNTILEMLGFSSPPSIPKEINKDSINEYKKRLQTEFGWSHLTMGGTTANIEALWVSRAVKYYPLAIWDVAQKEGLEIVLKHPNGTQQEIRKFTPYQILTIKPNEAIYLLARYVEAIRDKLRIPIGEAGERAYKLLGESKYSMNKGLGSIFKEFPPVVFVSGTAHYSIVKAVDILGIGKDNLELVKVDSRFRLDLNDLENKIKKTIAQKKVPLAVIGVLGTTEEGSVDPIHGINDLRTKIEREQNMSFWLHADAAWGGYIKSLFNFSDQDKFRIARKAISTEFKFKFVDDLEKWFELFFSKIHKDAKPYLEEDDIENKDKKPTKDKKRTSRKDFQSDLIVLRKQLQSTLNSKDYDDFLSLLNSFFIDHKFIKFKNIDSLLNLEDRVKIISDFVNDEIVLNWNSYKKALKIQWGDSEVCSSFISLCKTDSITIDPHKMGYVNYPCGLIAFKNDRVRHFILQRAPYITSVRQDVLIHMPPRHLEKIESENESTFEPESPPKIITEAFAPFIIEGSRPGAAATALWATIKCIPPTMSKMGNIIKSSLLSARELYEWLIHWNSLMEYNKIDTDYQFIPFTLTPPDLNIVIFGVKKKTSHSLSKMNQLTNNVYKYFSIESELGDREYSYSQPFFLSKTSFTTPNYSFDTLKDFFERFFGKNHLKEIMKTYHSEGLIVLRATVMNPYITPARKISNQFVIRDFMTELDIAARKSMAES